MDFLSSVPLPLLILMVFIAFLSLIGSLVFLLTRGNKPKTTNNENPFATAQTTNPELAQPPPDVVNPPPEPISTKLAKPNEGRFIFLIVIGATIAILIPILAVVFVKNQTLEPQETTQQTTTSPTCSAVTITDTLGSPLTQDSLSKLRPGDEVKVIISANSPSLEKARFRVNGSQWQEVTIKDGNNFTGNYILSTGTKKFTVEAEVYDKNKGWL